MLESLNIEYLIGGSVGMWAWAEPRMTMDVDLVIHLKGTDIRPLSEGLASMGILVPPKSMFDTLIQAEGDLAINANHPFSGYKAEFFLLRPGDEFRASTLARRRRVDLGKPIGEVYVHSIEGLMLNKLQYFAISQNSDKQVRDLAWILLASGDQIDWSYFNTWLGRLGLEPLWQLLLTRVDAYLSTNDHST